MTVDGRVDELTCEVYEVPTDRPEADGTLSWSSTIMVLVRVRSSGSEGLGWTYAGAEVKSVVDRVLSGVVLGPRRSGCRVPTRPCAGPAAI